MLRPVPQGLIARAREAGRASGRIGKTTPHRSDGDFVEQDQDLTSEFKAATREAGAHLVGVAGTERLCGLPTRPEGLWERFPRAVSLAVHLSDATLDMIEDVPTPLYHEHYLVVNGLLDRLATQATFWLQERGWSALPIPTSKTLDVRELRGAVSHKAVAVAAGVGWQGKSLLTVSPEYGPRIRLVSVLTNAPLAADEPLRNRCGGCSACVDACPVGAIRNVNTESHYESRDEALFFERCKQRVMVDNMWLEHIDHPICGVCIRACPWGQKSAKKAAARG